jgi:mitogen-activated protein kinase 1/3
MSEDKQNIFTTGLIDIILPEEVIDTDKDLFSLMKLDHVFLVMEQGERDLSSLLKNYKDIELEEDHIITIMYNILCALNFFHSANIIHRDIKPANILINSSCAVKICDFGLARVMPKKSDLEQNLYDFKNVKMMDICRQDDIEKRQSRLEKYQVEMTDHLKNTKEERAKKKRDMTCGIQTRWYRAPEVILTDKNYDKSVDIWSAGVILAELLKISI